MPDRRRLPRAAALLLALVAVVGAAPMASVAPAASVGSLVAPVRAADPLATEGPHPLPGYTPAFVTQREPGRWQDCTWASAAMFLDKWTAGQTIVDRKRLRALSGDREGGSSLADVEKAFGKIGMPLRWSPLGGESVTWPKLLDRLAQGGGAILLGDYGKLPRINGRWDPVFWRGDAESDDHAMYLDRYDPTRGRILVMDPLAPAGWTGEWIRVSALKAYAWRTPSGRLWAALTPPAVAGPFDGVSLGDPVASADGSTLRVSWPIESTPDGWTFPGADVRVQVMALDDSSAGATSARGSGAARPARDEPGTAGGHTVLGDPTALADPDRTLVGSLPVGSPAIPLPLDGVAPVGDRLIAAISLPPTPGVFRAVVTVTDRRTGAVVAMHGPLDVFVPGTRAAAIVAPSLVSVEPGALARIAAAVRNVGTEAWADARQLPVAPLAAEPPRNTRLLGIWVPVGDPPSDDGADDAARPTPIVVDLGSLDLAPGAVLEGELLVRAPVTPGHWRLVLTVADDVVGSFATIGSAPAIVDVEVHAPGTTF